VATTERKNLRAPPEGGPGVFDEMLVKLCRYYRGSVKHTLKECGMMKRYFSGGAQGKGDAGKRPEDDKGNGREKDNNFPVINNCFMIFGGPVAHDSRCQRKLEHEKSTLLSQPCQPSSTSLDRPSLSTVTTTRIVSLSRADIR
jgi:hypothetical protein